MAKKDPSTDTKTPKVESTSTPVRRTPSVRESRPAISEPVSKEIPVKKTSKKVEPKTDASDATTQITDQMIAERAYFISQSQGGSADDNWLQAERELRGGV